LKHKVQAYEQLKKSLRLFFESGDKKTIKKSTIRKIYYDIEQKRYIIYDSKGNELFSVADDMQDRESFLDVVSSIISENNSSNNFIMEVNVDDILEQEKPLSETHAKKIRKLTKGWTILNVLFYVILWVVSYFTNTVGIKLYSFLICVPVFNMYAFAWIFKDVVAWMEPIRDKSDTLEVHNKKLKQWYKTHSLIVFPMLIILLLFLLLGYPVISDFFYMIDGKLIPYLLGFILSIITLVLFAIRYNFNKARKPDLIAIFIASLIFLLFIANCIILITGKESKSYDSMVIEHHKKTGKRKNQYATIILDDGREHKIVVSRQEYAKLHFGKKVQIIHYQGVGGTEWINVIVD